MNFIRIHFQWTNPLQIYVCQRILFFQKIIHHIRDKNLKLKISDKNTLRNRKLNFISKRIELQIPIFLYLLREKWMQSKTVLSKDITQKNGKNNHMCLALKTLNDQIVTSLVWGEELNPAFSKKHISNFLVGMVWNKDRSMQLSACH